MEKKRRFRFFAAILNSAVLGIASLLAGGVLADYASALENRFIGFFASALPFFTLIFSFIAGKALLKKEISDEKISGSLPSFREMMLTGALTATVLLVAIPFRLWSDKLFSEVGYTPINDYLTMNSLIEAGVCLLIIYPLFDELFNRFLLQPAAEKLFSGWRYYLVLSISYALIFPRVQNFLSGIAVGLMLVILYRLTKKHLLCYISSLFLQIIAFLYSVMLSYGISDGSGMGYKDLCGITIIFFTVAAVAVFAIYSIFKKRKPHPIDICAAVLVTVILLFLGMVLAGS